LLEGDVERGERVVVRNVNVGKFFGRIGVVALEELPEAAAFAETVVKSRAGDGANWRT
jgi:hypothetical protein